MPLRVSSLPLMASVGPFALEPAAHLESLQRTDPKGQPYLFLFNRKLRF